MVTTQAPIEAIDTFVQSQMELGRMPGLGLAVLHQGVAVLERGYGYADVAKQTPMTERTPVVIGSTTKAMTAAAVMQLVEGGRLALDDRIRAYLPSFRLADEEVAARITVRHLLT